MAQRWPIKICSHFALRLTGVFPNATVPELAAYLDFYRTDGIEFDVGTLQDM